MIKGRQLDSKEQQLWNTYIYQIKVGHLKKNHKVIFDPPIKRKKKYLKIENGATLPLKPLDNSLMDCRLKKYSGRHTINKIEAVGIRRPGLDNQTWRKLNRGQLRPEKILDLHGYTAHSALAQLEFFLMQSYRDKVRCVEVITGKGSVYKEGGILRRELPIWLNRSTIKPLILATVHPNANNTGAVRILLRRKRN
ncbi:hypothetical protein COMNV_00925 [Commensalibacter sp. Nvir]|uniref:Smr/MutS family protein n=1 Tax=Commensalibacter sp. Nvir TaxID=3069817 RepID=UPI002D75BA27|nr:hypothetical protein COMNV_00925 [Commensalibacter sp. Nvir]